MTLLVESHLWMHLTRWFWRFPGLAWISDFDARSQALA